MTASSVANMISLCMSGEVKHCLRERNQHHLWLLLSCGLEFSLKLRQFIYANSHPVTEARNLALCSQLSDFTISGVKPA